MIVPIFFPYLGCHHRCTYCDQKSIIGFEKGSVFSYIAQTLDPYTNTGKQIEVGLFGGNILGIEYKTLIELFSYFDPYEAIIQNFRISTKPVSVDTKTIHLLKERRVTIIELGIPIFNNTILRHLNRHHTVEDLFAAYAILKDNGFSVALQVMVGLPNETREDMERATKHIINLNPAYLRIYPLVIFRGTPLFSQYEEGTFSPVSFNEVLLRTSLLYLSALKHNIKVVKIGLTANEIIENNVAGGYYHPAFGYLVRAKVFYDALTLKLEQAGNPKRVTVLLNKKDIPHLVGYRRSHMHLLAQNGVSIEWQAIDCNEGTFIITVDGGVIEGTVFDGHPTL